MTENRSDEAEEVIRAHAAGAPTDTQLLAFVREIVALRAALAASRAETDELRTEAERRWAVLACPACHARNCDGHLAAEGMTLNGHEINRLNDALAAVRVAHAIEEENR